MQERKEGGVYSEEAVKNAQEEDNAATSAVKMLERFTVMMKCLLPQQ